MSRYRKISPTIWNDDKFRSLSDDAQLVFFYLLTHPHQTSLGAMRASVPGLAAEKLWKLPRFEKAFGDIEAREMLRHDPESSFVWLPKFLKHNPPENPNVVKSWIAGLDLLPECRMKFELIDCVKEFVEGLPEGFREALPEPFRKSMPIQEQEQEQEQDTDKRQNPKNCKTGSFPEFESAWELYPKRAGSNSKDNALKAWSARIHDGALPAEMIAGVQRYAAFIRATGKERSEFVKQASTFFGPAKHYLEDFELPRTGADAKRSAGGFVG